MRTQMKTTILVSVLGLSLALNASFAVGLLRSGASAHAGLPQGTGDRCLLDRLDLDPAQRRQLAGMRRRMHEKRAAFWRRAGAIKARLAEAICADGTDREALDAELRRYAENQAAMQRAVADHLRGVNAMLRPGQRSRFRALLRAEMFRGIRVSGDGAASTDGAAVER